MIADRYRLEEQIGAGATASIWRATDLLLDRRVAVKRLTGGPGSDEEARLRFLRGAAAAARLQHPGIVSIYDAGEDEEGPYIVMELVESKSLAERLADGTRYSLAEVVSMVGQVAAALDHAHGNGIVHRDVKPGNLLIDEEGRVRVTDFGLARPVHGGDTVTATGQMVGTPAYLAPEVIVGEPTTPASDIYSLGVIAYEMVSGRRPFTGDTTMALLESIRRDDPPPLVGVTSPEAAAAIAKVMAKDPRDRYRSAAEFAAAMGESSTVVLAMPPPPVEATRVLETESASAPVEPAAPPAASPRRWRSLALLGAGALVLSLLLLSRAFDGGDPGVAAPIDTTTPAPATTSLPALTTTAPTTTTPTTLRPEGPLGVAADIYRELEQMRPPEFKPKEVRELRETVEDVIEAWEEGRSDRVEDRLERAFEQVDDLPDSEERETLEELLEMLADEIQDSRAD